VELLGRDGPNVARDIGHACALARTWTCMTRDDSGELGEGRGWEAQAPRGSAAVRVRAERAGTHQTAHTGASRSRVSRRGILHPDPPYAYPPYAYPPCRIRLSSARRTLVPRLLALGAAGSRHDTDRVQACMGGLAVHTRHSNASPISSSLARHNTPRRPSQLLTSNTQRCMDLVPSSRLGLT